MFNKSISKIIFIVGVLLIALGVCFAQRSAMPFPGADADSLKIEHFYGSQTVITASNERVTISHVGNNCVIYIDTRVKK